MNMLIIGNGFDLAHGRPTTYSDFLQFLSSVQYIEHAGKGYTCSTADILEKDCPQAKDYLLSSLEIRKVHSGKIVNSNRNIQEILDYLKWNIWYEYFKWIQKENLMHGKNWIDFELEIREIIEFFDRKIHNIYDPVSEPQAGTEKSGYFWLLFCKSINRNNLNKYTWSDFITITYQDLEHLVRCLEIYLDDCLGEIPIKCYSPDIQELNIDFVLSFNYTAIPTKIYPSLTNVHYIHGCAKVKYPNGEINIDSVFSLELEDYLKIRAEYNQYPSKELNNMVLGVNEYWDGPEKNFRTNFNPYKKFVQRLIKETGIDYKNMLYKMSSEYKLSQQQQAKTKGYIGVSHSNVYIFGHSLDVTDGDILREVIQTPGAVTTIFYRNKRQQANQIANLSKVLGQDELLKRTFSTSPSIIFKKQAEMVPTSTLKTAPQ